MAYRPRGTLARTLYDKIHNDQHLEGYDMKLVCLQTFTWPAHASPFIFLPFFSGTRCRNRYQRNTNRNFYRWKNRTTSRWVGWNKRNNCLAICGYNYGIWRHDCFSAFSWHRRQLMGTRSRNDFQFIFNRLFCRLLKRGSMFILSEEQFKNLLTAGGFNANFLSARNNEITILDIGAGDGEVTMRLAKSIIHMNYNIFLKVLQRNIAGPCEIACRRNNSCNWSINSGILRV